MVVGLLKPMILLPPALLCGLEPQQLSLILAHELAHIRRFDLLVNLCQRVIEALLFFHPVIWWISHRIRIERENCCDDLASGDTDQLTYATALLRTAELCVGSDSKQAASLAAMSADGGNATEISARIRRLIDAEDSPKIGLSKNGLRLLTIMIFVSTLCVAAWGSGQLFSAVQSQLDDVPHEGRIVAHVYKYESGMGASHALETAGELTTGYYSYYPQQAKSNWKSLIKWNLLESKKGLDTYRLEIKFEPKTGASTTTTHDLVFDGAKAATVNVNEWLTVSIEPPRVEKPESWEVSKIYDEEFLRFYLKDHEVLPNPIEVPAIRGQVVGPDGQPVSQVAVLSHTPRQHIGLEGDKIVMAASPGPIKRTDAQGKFGLPKRTEAYRVLLVHNSGVASVDHETLIRNQGKVVLQPWATVTGTLVVDGKPLANQRISLQVNTLNWSYRRFTPHIDIDFAVNTDANGVFRFEKVPPLPARVYHSPSGELLQRLTAISCESGKTSSVKLGEGQTVTGSLILTDQYDTGKLSISVVPVVPSVPYPEELEDSPWEQKRAWAGRWYATDAGMKFGEEQFIKSNTRYVGKREPFGQFKIYGIPTGEMQLIIRSPEVKEPIVKPFSIEEISDQPLDLGRLEFSADPPLPDVKLPKLIVKAVDEAGAPIAKTTVQLLDRHGFRASGLKMSFKPINKQTNADGIVDMGQLPRTFFCIQMDHQNPKFSDCYTVLSRSNGKFIQAKPERSNVQIEQEGDVLTVTITMLEETGFEFEVVDKETGKDIFWPEISYQDSIGSWWVMAIIDGGGQHNFMPLSAKMLARPLRITADGYKPVYLSLPNRDTESPPTKHRIEMKPGQSVKQKLRSTNKETATPESSPQDKTESKKDATKLPSRAAFGVVVNDDGEPIEGVKIQAATPVQGFYSSFSSPTGGDDINGKTAVTDKAGRFRIDDITAPGSKPNREGQLEVMLRLRSPYRWTNDDNYKLNEELRITLRGSGKQGTLRLKLVDDVSGKPIPEFMIVRRHKPLMQTTLNEDGEYDVVGKFTRHRKSSVYCYAAGYEAKSAKIEALDPDSDERIEVRLKRRPSLKVRIVDEKTGKPIPQAKIMAASLETRKPPARYIAWKDFDRYVDGLHSFNFVRRKLTDEFGLVDFSRLPESESALMILVDGYQRMVIRQEDQEAFPVVGGALQIALKAESSIVGQLTANGQPMADRSVSISSYEKIGGLDQMMGGVKTDEDGRYEFRSLLPGKYWVTVDGRASRINVGDEQYRHDVALDGTTVLGKTDPNANVRAVPQFKTTYANVDALSDSDGKFTMTGLSPGPHKFEIRFTTKFGFRMDYNLDPIDITETDEMPLELPSKIISSAREQ